jgi:hypothetical protein
MILVDNGSGAVRQRSRNAGRDDDDLHGLHQIHGSNFDVVDTSSLRNG